MHPVMSTKKEKMSLMERWIGRTTPQSEKTSSRSDSMYHVIHQFLSLELLEDIDGTASGNNEATTPHPSSQPLLSSKSRITK